MTILTIKRLNFYYTELYTESKAMFTLCWIAFYAVVKNTPATWREQKWPKT